MNIDKSKFQNKLTKDYNVLKYVSPKTSGTNRRLGIEIGDAGAYACQRIGRQVYLRASALVRHAYGCAGAWVRLAYEGASGFILPGTMRIDPLMTELRRKLI